MQWVANEESLYNDIHGMYDGWVEEGDSWDESDARKQATALIAHIAHALEGQSSPQGKYTKKEISEAVDEVIKDFDDYREQEIAEIVKQAAMKPEPADLAMDAEDIEYAKKQEELILKIGRAHMPQGEFPGGEGPREWSPRLIEQSRKAGIEHIRGYMPVSAEKIRQALQRGDKHLNTIKLRKWDEMATMMGYRNLGLSLSQVVGVLKHVAKWHFA